MRRPLTIWLVLVLLGLVGAPGALADPVAFRWSVPAKLAGDGVDGVARKVDEATLRTTEIEVRTCAPDPSWSLDGAPVTPTPAGRCRARLDLGDDQEHTLVLRSEGEEASATVRARDLLVVTVGDSVSSGEGNPDGPSVLSPRWLERRCHRSMRSGAAQAALALESGSTRSAVTLLALGCSGATVPRGLLGSYAGIEPDARRGPLPAQLDEVARLASRRMPDAVLVSIGANDVNFGAVARFCVVVARCPERRFDPARSGGVAKDPAAPTAAEVQASAIAGLPERYAQVAARLRDARVPADRVVLVEYFDPTHDEEGEVCEQALPGIDRDEAAWAFSSVVVPLNAQARLAALRHGWRFVGGVQDAFLAHGICARGHDRWVRRIEESLGRGSGLSGPLHPNGLGHLATAALIGPVLADATGVSGGTDVAQAAGRPDDEGSRVAWWWLVVTALAGALAGGGLAILAARRRRP